MNKYKTDSIELKGNITDLRDVEKLRSIINNLMSLAETIEYVGDDYDDIRDRLCKECELTPEDLERLGV